MFLIWPVSKQLVRKFSFSVVNFNRNRLLEFIAEMPKEQTHIPALKSQRKAKKIAQSRYPPATVSLQVLGNGNDGAPRSLYVFTDQSRYLFNCGESSQRLAHEHKLKLSKLEHIFFTHSSWRNLGGLPGVTLTIQDVGVPNVKLHGPPGLEQLFEAASRFIVLKDLEVSCVDATTPNTSHEDSVMKVTYVPIFPTISSGKSTPDSSHSDNNEVNSENQINYYSGESKEPSKKRMRMWSPLPPAAKAAISYICRLQPKKGILLFERCVELGVPVGPLLGRLKEGQDVTLPDGRIIKSCDVRSPDDPGPIFLVVECPDEAYLEDFLANESLKAFHSQNLTSEVEMPAIVVHFTPLKLTKHPRYVDWIEGFPPSTHHMMMGIPDREEESGGRDLGSIAVHRIQHKLHLLHPEIFPLLPSDFDIKTEEQRTAANLKTLLQFHLRPKKFLDEESVLNLAPDVYKQECYNVVGFVEELEALKKNLLQHPPEGDEYPKIIFFGTGSQIPSKTRNTSAILIELAPQCFILLDCGEGTYNQLVRFYGPKDSLDVLSNLEAVYISHLHADHHIGLIGVLQGRQRAREKKQLPSKPIFLIAPEQITYWLTWYDRMMERIQTQFKLIACQHLMSGPADSSVLEALQLKAAMTTRVRHCPNAFGVALTTSKGYKMTYSGDTMPCDDLVRLGLDSHLLIHEATMEDGMEKEAALKTHSTTSQAIEVGRRMKAKFIMLTHFSQRYAKIPVFGPQFNSDVGVAFDNMRLSPAHLHQLPHLIPALKLVFAEHVEDLENRTLKRQLREETSIMAEQKQS